MAKEAAGTWAAFLRRLHLATRVSEIRWLSLVGVGNPAFFRKWLEKILDKSIH
jgi:hypothetical protein